MGIYSRYSAAFLAFALISPQVFSAVRVPVIQNNEYIRQVLSKQTATTGAVTTPAGDVAFYGAEKVYAFSAGDSVRPTVREVVSTVGTPSYPYGPGAAYPNDPNLSPASATKIKVKPQVVVPKSNILAALKSGIKSNPGQLALTETVAAAVSAVGWVMSPDNTQIQKKATDRLGGYPFSDVQTSLSSSCQGAIGVVTKESSFYRMHFQGAIPPSPWNYVNSCGAGPLGGGTGVVIADLNAFAVETSPSVPLEESDLSSLDPWVSSQSAEWLSGLIKDVCNGSPNPGGCFAQMADRSKGIISGPATAQGPTTSKTTSTTNPDGSVSTRTETTSTKYNFQYSNNYFDVNTEKKTTTTQDGQPVSETIENDNTPVEEPPDPTEQPEEPEPEYTFEDSPFPEVEPFYEQKYPDGLQGVWDQARADIDNSNFLSFLRSFVPSFSGSCPSFGMSFAIGSMANFGTHEFQSLCYVFDFIKVILMVSAVFLARQLTFGG